MKEYHTPGAVTLVPQNGKLLNIKPPTVVPTSEVGNVEISILTAVWQTSPGPAGGTT